MFYKRNLSLFLIGLTCMSATYAKSQDKDFKITVPEKIVCGKQTFNRDKAFPKYVMLKYGDINGDGKKEAVVRFIISDSKNKGRRNLTAVYFQKNPAVPAFIIIRDSFPADIEFFDIDGDKANELILYENTGAHYTDIAIYKYHKKQLHKIFANGTACYLLKIDTDQTPVRIRIGRENWDYKHFCYMNSAHTSLVEAWEWKDDKFIFKRHLSTTVPVSEEKAIDDFAKKIIELMNKK